MLTVNPAMVQIVSVFQAISASVGSSLTKPDKLLIINVADWWLHQS